MHDSKNEGLQAGRAIAALTVAYFHSYVAVRGFPESAQAPLGFLKEWGFLGVNLFFAISGYVICLVTDKASFTVRSFAVKRIFRLYPMYWVSMMVIVLMIWKGKYPAQPIGHFLYSMTLLPQNVPPAYDLSWTLEREFIFYALAAIAVPTVGIPGLAVLLACLAYAGLRYANPPSFHLISTLQADFLGGINNCLLHPRALQGQIEQRAGRRHPCSRLFGTLVHAFARFCFRPDNLSGARAAWPR